MRARKDELLKIRSVLLLEGAGGSGIGDIIPNGVPLGGPIVGIAGAVWLAGRIHNRDNDSRVCQLHQALGP